MPPTFTLIIKALDEQLRKQQHFPEAKIPNRSLTILRLHIFITKIVTTRQKHILSILLVLTANMVRYWNYHSTEKKCSNNAMQMNKTTKQTKALSTGSTFK